MTTPGNVSRLAGAAALLAGLLAAPAAAADAAADHAHCHPGAGGEGSTAAVRSPPPIPPPGGAGAPVAGARGDGHQRSERRYRVPDVTLVDEHARAVRLREALDADGPVLVNFIFTTCNAICPVMSGIFARVPRELGEDAERVRLVSISIDPEQDTPARLRAYAARFSAGPGWRFLTGSAADVAAVQRAFDAYRGDKMNHEPLTLLHAGPGRPWIRLDGFASAAALAREVREVVRP